MQGKLSEIDIRSILQLIELGQRTGELFVEAYPSQPSSLLSESAISPQESHFHKLNIGQNWFVFFLNGQIVYATNTEASVSRLSDYLRRYRIDIAPSNLVSPALAATNAPEYGYLWRLLENHTLTPAQGRSIIQGMVQETLFDLLSLHQGAFVFELAPPLSPQLSTLEISPLLAKIMKQIQQWKQLHPHIQSPEQCPVVADVETLRRSLAKQTFDTLDRYADGKTSIRQMARYLNRDILTVGRAIFPYVQQGLIQLMHPSAAPNLLPSQRLPRPNELQAGSELRIPRVVCIDDGATVRETVTMILHQHGYDGQAIGDPIQALSLVFQIKPDLILCDIAMPELDGYEICAMLRKSTAFRQTPIVMLTGKDGFIDRIKARMVGATDYLTKPFGENELLMLIEKYVGLSYPDRRQHRGAALSVSSDGDLNVVDPTSTSSTPFS